MNIEKITALYDIAVGLISDTLYYILDALPEQSYEFRRSIRVPHADSFTGNLYNVSIYEVFLDNLGVACCRYHDEFENDGKCDLHSLDDNTLYFILNSIDKDTLSKIR